MKGKEKKKRFSYKESEEKFWETFNMKIDETRGLYIGTEEGAQAVRAVSEMFARGTEAREKVKQTKLNCGLALADAVFMGTQMALYERDQSTLVALNTYAHIGDSQIRDNARNFKPRKLLKKLQ